MRIKEKLKLVRVLLFLHTVVSITILPSDQALADQPASFIRTVSISVGKNSEDPKIGSIKTIEQTGSANQPIVLGEITGMKIDQPRYAITGLIRYSNVKGTGFLEMWNYFPGGGQYFTRALGTEEMAPITGNSEWRRFILPFYMDNAPAKMSPERVVFDLVLPEGGAVSLAQVELHQFSASQNPLTAFAGGWWRPESLNSFFIIITPAVVALSLLVSILAYRGKARAFVIGMIKGSAVVGSLLLLALAIGYLKAQPVHILLPLGIGGLVLLSPLSVHLPSLNKRYAQIEERRMAAHDLMV